MVCFDSTMWWINSVYFLRGWTMFYLLINFSKILLAANVEDQKGEVLNMSGKISDGADISAPPELLVEKLTYDSVLLSWKPPRISSKKLKLFTYSLTLTPNIKTGLERELSLPPGVTWKHVSGLSEGARYVVQLAAIFGDPGARLAHRSMLRLAAPNFALQLPSRDLPQRDLPPAIEDGEPPCDCSESGAVACTRGSGWSSCACRPGFAGERCDECASGNFRAGKDCLPCPCSNVTSTALCTLQEDSGLVSCACLPGHRGSLCSSCAAGYRWDEERCVPLQCLSSGLCAQDRDAPGCEDCLRPPATALRTNSERGGVADGTLPLIAVVATLAVLLAAAGLAACYRHWDNRRHRLPLWSIELQSEATN